MYDAKQQWQMSFIAANLFEKLKNTRSKKKKNNNNR